MLKMHFGVIPTTAEKLQDKILLRSTDRDNAHKFAAGSAAILFKDGETIYADIGKESALVHDEHKTIMVAPGIYVMDRVREFDPSTEEVRRVID